MGRPAERRSADDGEDVALTQDQELLAIAAAGWGIVLVSWLVRHRRMTSHEHKLGMYRALAVWALTDVAVVVAFAM